jgi:hypothetical protein
MFPASTHQGYSVAGFPDVCKTPSPAGPVPIPYPNAFGYGQQNTAGSKTTSVGSKPALTKNSNFSMSSGDEAGAVMGKQIRNQQLRGKLQVLHMQIGSLPSGDPTRWHRLLDEYVVLTAELYKTLSE